MRWRYARVVGAHAVTVVSLLALPTAALAVGAPHEEPLPDVDVRKASPEPALERAQIKLERSLGPQGFADPSATGEATGFVGRTDGYLSGRTDASARRVALDYMRENRAAFGLDADDIEALDVDDESYTSWEGVRHLTFTQLVDGVPSYDTFLRANVDSDGRLINLSGGPAGDLARDDPNPRLDRRQALVAARENVGGSRSPRFGELESARLVAFARADGRAELAWAVYAESDEGFLYEVVIGADSGEVLLRQSRTNFANQADVWNLHPDQNVPPTRVNLGADPTWIDDTAGGTKLRGNNAHAYADVDNNNTADPAEEVAQVGGDWLFPITWFNHQPECPAFGCTWDSTDNTTKATNQKQATTGLFYLTNRFHDHLLQPPIGFDEASRNFEQVNASGMGLGGDRVRAEANDSYELNNAVFHWTADGSPPRMEMFFWNAGWDVSSSDDAEIVYHEYTHGLTNRLVGNGGGLTTFQAAAMGEGWSDWYALDFLVEGGAKVDGPGEDLAFGDYVGGGGTGSGGIRNQRIDCNPDSPATFCPAGDTTGPGGFTFGDLGRFVNGGSVHANGEIWSQTLWDLREELGVHDARAVITGGLRLAPNAPSYLQMRDAILQSALTLGISRIDIWRVFADRGMGFSATTAGSGAVSAVEAFDLPNSLVHVGTDVSEGGVLGDGDGYAEPDETLLLTTALDKQFEATVDEVSGELATTTPGTLLGTAETAWDFPAGEQPPRVNDPVLSATLQAAAPCGGDLELSIDVQSSAGAVSVPPVRMAVGEPTFQLESPRVAIPDNNTGGVNTTITMPPGTIRDMDLAIPNLVHTRASQLRLNLTSPSGTSVWLVSGAGGDSPGFADLILDDEASQRIVNDAGSAEPVGGRYRPHQPLSAFDGENSAGVWKLNVSDHVSGGVGTLNTWGLKDGADCSTTAPPLPVAQTSEPAAVGATTATLAGQVNPRGVATSYAFEYGTGHAYDTRTSPQPAGGGSSSLTETTAITGLGDQTTYQYRMVALREGAVIARGERRVLTTLALGCEAADTDLAHAERRLVDARQSRDGAEQRAAEAQGELAVGEERLSSAKRKLAKAKRKLNRAKASGERAEEKQAKRLLKRAKKAVRRAKETAEAARVEADAASAALEQAQADEAQAESDVASARAAISAYCP